VGGDSDTQAGPEELVLARAGDSEALDLHQTTAAYSSMVMSLIYDPLVHLDFDGNVHDGLGTPWEVSDDGTEWTTEIHEGIEFHNGDSLTADDVVFTYERALEMPAEMSWALGSMSGVEAVDDMTVTFTFDQPHAPWETYSAYPGYFGILPRGPVEENSDEFATDPVGSGPYQLENWVRDSELTLSRYDNHNTPLPPEVESEDAPLPQQITYRVIPEETPRVQALLSGDVDMLVARDFPQRSLEQIQSNDQTTADVYTDNNAGYVAFNMELEPTDDVTVRRALAHAIDRDRIIEDIYRGLGKKTPVPMSENLLGWAGDEVDHIPFDPERAGELLEEAGWEDTGGEFREKDGEPLRLEVYSTNSPPPRVQLAEEMVAMLAEVGVDANLTTYEYNTAYAEFEQGDAHVMYGTVSWFDPDVLSFVWHSDNAGASNLSFLQDDEIDELIEQAAQTVDTDERAATYVELQQKAMDMVPCQPIMTYEAATGMRSNIEGYKQHPSLLTPMYHDVQISD
jgi:peptide/nickel transport system substrate-binding protein